MPKEIKKTPEEKYLEELRKDTEKAKKEASNELKALVENEKKIRKEAKDALEALDENEVKAKRIRKKEEELLQTLADGREDIEVNLKYSITKNAKKLIVLNTRDKTAEFDEESLDHMARHSILSNALKQTSISELEKAIRTGDTKNLENTVMNHLVEEKNPPKVFLKHFATNARNYAESLQKEMDGPKFKQLSQGDQVNAYAKLLGVRASIRAARNTFRGKSLDKPLNLASYRNTLKQMEAEQPVNDALCNLIKKNGAGKVNSWACNGHGGLLEDKVKLEIRGMAKTPPYKLGDPIPEQFRPTVKERLQDIQEILSDDAKWNRMEEQEKKQLISEFALLSKKAKTPEQMNAVMGDIKEHNEAAQSSAGSKSLDEHNIEILRGNLTKTPLEKVIDGFNKTQQKAQEETAPKERNEALKERKSEPQAGGFGPIA